MVPERLDVLVVQWRQHQSNMSGGEFLRLLQDHQQQLWQIFNEIKNKITNTEANG
jgi:hypothetical protein